MKQNLLIFIVIFLFVIFIISSFVGSTPQKQGSKVQQTSTETKFPVQTLDLRDTSWEYNTFSGSITNNGKKDVFNLKVRLAVSKTRERWDPEEQVVTIPYKIQSGQTITFSKSVTSAGSNDPWWTSNIIDARYYNGEKVPTLPIIPTKSLSQQSINNQQPIDNSPWGVAKQIDEHTWTMKVGQDDRIGTPREIFDALNAYRERAGGGRLTWDENLVSFAQTRAAYFNSIKNLDAHAGFIEYTKSADNLKKLGFWGVGENANYGQRLLGVHLIEWIYAGDKPHDDNQLDPTWTHVGVGVSGLGVSIIFGKWKM